MEEFAALKELVQIFGPAGALFLYIFWKEQRNGNGKNSSTAWLRSVLKSASQAEELKTHDNYFDKKCKPEMDAIEKRLERDIGSISDNQFKLMLAFQRANPDVPLLDDPTFELTLQRKKNG